MKQSIVSNKNNRICLSRYKFADSVYSERRINQDSLVAQQLFVRNVNNVKWTDPTGAANVQLSVHFLKSPYGDTSKEEFKIKEVIESKINAAKFIGVLFKFVPREQAAHIRVSLLANQGSWSAIGKEALTIDPDLPTMNISFLEQGNILHQFAHALGFMHEHKYENGIEWNEPLVEATFAGLPNKWTAAETKRNLIDIFNIDQFMGSRFDTKSIMRHVLPCELFVKKNSFCIDKDSSLPTDFSEGDKQFLARFYPVIDSTKVYIPQLTGDETIATPATATSALPAQRAETTFIISNVSARKVDIKLYTYTVIVILSIMFLGLLLWLLLATSK